MRRSICVGVTVVLALTLATVALAQFTQTAGVTLTAHTAGSSTGISANLSSSDPAAPGQKPKAATKLVLTFPPRTKFNLGTSLGRTCTLTNKQLTTSFGPACPRRSRIGSGSAIVNASPLQQTVKTTVKAYIASRHQIVLVVQPTLAALSSEIIVIRGTVSGPKLTIPIPRVALGKEKGFGGVQAVLVSLKLALPALGHGSEALITAGRCPAHDWSVRAQFTYADHSRLTLHSTSRCRG